MNYLDSSHNVSEEQTAASEESSFGDVLSRFEEEQRSSAQSEGSARETIEGTVVAVTDDSVVIDIGRKMEGMLPLTRLIDARGDAEVRAGDKLPVVVTGHASEGYYLLSTLKVERPKDWSSLELAFAEKRVIAATVQEVIKGGLRVDVGARAFLPASRSGARDQAELEALVGQEIRCRITKLDVEDEDVVVDRRAVLEEEERQAREQRFSELAEGAIVRGTVRSVTDFGAFVDLGGIDGLLHVTDMSWTRVAKPSDVVSVGDSVDVQILKVNPATRKISLGMKQLTPDPWTVALEKFKVGDRVRGTVVRLTDFGAFVELMPGVDGMIHVSEMSWAKKVRKPSDVLKNGETVDAVVLSINPADRRIGLGLKQALGDPWEEVPKRFPIGSVVEAPVTNMANFGAFVDLGDGVEGMIHIGDISREKRLNHPREVLATGQTVKAQVLEIDRERRRIRLGMKQLEPTSVDEYIAERQTGETVTGRIVDVSASRARVELGEGVYAQCRLAPAAETEKASEPEPRPADLSSLTAMLAAKWKEGKAPGGAASAKSDLRPGQIRSFRIVALDPAQKRIEVELAG